jgi:hypothetical protein
MVSNWYLTEIIFSIKDDKSPGSIRFDKQVRLLEAISERDAYQKVLSIASKELDYLNVPSLKNLTWEFVGIEYLHATDCPEDGVELHYSIEEQENPEEYIRDVRMRNADLQTQIALTA